jgi:hypothetical protein
MARFLVRVPDRSVITLNICMVAEGRRNPKWFDVREDPHRRVTAGMLSLLLEINEGVGRQSTYNVPVML